MCIRDSVINMSLGIDSPNLASVQPITDVIQDAIDNNVFIVAASGNDGQLMTPTNYSYPGSPLGAEMEGFINVGSSDVASGSISRFSNYSDTYVEIMAPGSTDSSTGVGLLMPDPGSDPANSYDRASGTSFASPIVAGAAGLVIGLLRSRGENPTPAEIEAALKDGAISEPGFSGRTQDLSLIHI